VTVSSRSRKILGWSLTVPFLATAFVAACGLDVVGRVVPSDDATTPPSDRDGTSVEEEGGAPPDGSAPDAKVPETCSWSALERNAPWPMIGGCVRHPGRTAHRGPKKLPKVLWKITVTTRETHPVIGADGTIYVPADTSGLAAFTPDGGRRPIPDAGTGMPNNVTNVPSIGEDGTLYFGAERDVVALGANGTRWRSETGGEIDTSTLVDEDGTVYSGSFDDSLYAFGPDGGARWKVDLGGDIWAAPAIGPTGEIYIGANDRLYALERDGGESWRFTTTGNIQSSPVIADDGTVYIGTTGARLHAIGPDGGAQWAFTTKGSFGWQQLPALGQDGTIYTPTGATLAAIAPDGGLKWERNVGIQLHTSVVVDADGDIYVGGNGRMFAYAPDGTQLWSFELGANASGFAIGRDGTIYVACNDDSLLALHE
jgi:hypothetical protein